MSVGAIVFAFLMFSGFRPADHTLTVRVNGIEKFQGQVMLAIYNQQEGFLDLEKMYRAQISPLTNESGQTITLSLPPGEYAVTVFQDLNQDRKLNTNFVGIPREPYGFSNNPRILFGPPDFDASSFLLVSDMTINIDLQ